MSKNKSSQAEENQPDFIKQKIRKEFLKSQREIALMIKEHDYRPKLSEKLTSLGVFFAGISTLREVSIAYLVGLVSKEELDKYMQYERELVLLKSEESYQGYKIHDAKGNEIEIPDVKINASFSIEAPCYDDVLEYARGKGHILQIPEDVFTLAKELKRTSSMFQVLKVNVADLKFPIEDELPASHWDHFSKLETEYNILQNLIILHKSLPYEDENLNAFLNAEVYLRLKSNIEEIEEYLKNNVRDPLTFLRVQCGVSFLSSLIPVSLNANEEERKILLLVTIQRARDALKRYPDKEWGQYLIDWIDRGVEKFEEDLPLSYYLKEVHANIDVLNSSYMNNASYSDENEVVEPTLIKIPKRSKEIKFSKDFASLSREEQLIQLCQNYHFTVFDGIDATINRVIPEQIDELKKEISSLDSIHKKLFKVLNLSEIYTYFMLGIVTKQQADDISKVMDSIFDVRSIAALGDKFPAYVSNFEGYLSEKIEESYNLFLEAKKTGDYSKINITQVLVDLDVPLSEIEKMVPTVRETITCLMQNDFDKYAPLALRFKKEYFDLVEQVREGAKLALDNMSGQSYLALTDVLPDRVCEASSIERTRINRLLLINDVFQSTWNSVPASDKVIKARILLRQMIYASLQKTLKDLEALPSNEHYTEITPQLRWMSRYLSKNLPNPNVLSKEDENMAFLASMSRYMLKKFTNSKSTRAHYLDWFDKIYGRTQAEDNLNLKTQLPIFRGNKHAFDLMTEKEKVSWIDGMVKFYYDAEQQSKYKEDSRAVFGLCSDVELLFSMGILSPHEYSVSLAKMEALAEVASDDQDVGIKDIYQALQQDDLPIYLPLNAESMSVMRQIRIAGEILNDLSSYGIEKSDTPLHTWEGGHITQYDLSKNPLMAEGRMLQVLLSIAGELPEMTIENHNSLKNIADSYWRQSAQLLNTLQTSLEKTHPDISERISLHKSFFGLTKVDKVERISDRMHFYPRLFQIIRKGIMIKYDGNYRARNQALSFFEKTIAPFVAYYKGKSDKNGLNRDNSNQRS